MIFCHQKLYVSGTSSVDLSEGSNIEYEKDIPIHLAVGVCSVPRLAAHVSGPCIQADRSDLDSSTTTHLKHSPYGS